MNIWYVISLILVAIGILFFVGCLLGSIFNILKTVKSLNATMTFIKNQMNPIQERITGLKATINILQADIELKKQEIQYVTDAVKNIKDNLFELMHDSKIKTKKVIEKTEKDPERNAQTQQWTNSALSLLKRQA